MIFTHIFRYLDDRDAEELRRQSDTNSSSPTCPSSAAAESRCQEPPREHSDGRLRHLSLTDIPPKISVPKLTFQSSGQTERLFQTLSPGRGGFPPSRADATRLQRPTTSSVLPPIRGSEIALRDDNLGFNDKHSAQLPPIDSLGSRAKTRKARSSSFKGKRGFWRNACNSKGLEEKEKHERKRANTERIGFSGSGDEAGVYTQQSTKAATEGRNSTVSKQTEGNSGDNTSVLANVVKKREFNGDYQETEKKDAEDSNTSETTKQSLQKNRKVELTGIDAITSNASCKAKSGQTAKLESNKTNDMEGEWLQKKEWAKHKAPERKLKAGDIFQCLGLGSQTALESDVLTLSAQRQRNRRQKSNSVRNTHKETFDFEPDEYSSLETSKQERSHTCVCDLALPSLVLSDKGRRNAICEVIEKKTVPEFGSSLYEMRRNLLKLY